MCTIFQKFDLYDAIIAHDYMRHEAITAGVRGVLAGCAQPLRVLDVGCGNGWMARESLREALVSKYIGVDLSADALERVRARPPLGVKPTEAAMELRCDDLFLVLPGLPAGSFEVVMASFSLHHFSQEKKRELLAGIERILAPGGVFIWTDVARKPGQTRDQFNASLAKEMRENWLKLEPAEREKVVDHVEESDFPEEVGWMVTECDRAGFKKWEQLFKDDFFGAWVFRQT